MVNNNQAAPVSDEELDQMILKLERDGMTPKQLSLMRELREVRRAKGEPVAQIEVISGVLINERWMHSSLPNGWHDLYASRLSGNSEQLKPVSNRDELPATQFKPVSDLYGITSPTGSETSFTFDAIEAVNFIEGGWSVQEYVELERYQEAMIGNSPATPDGWVMVPVEPTYQMCQAMALSWESPRFPDRYKAMIEAAPDFRENVNSSTRYFLEISETSTNCPKCGGRGTYHCPQMLGTVECECTLPAAPKEVQGE